MEGVKFGKSTVVMNGESKEILTRSLAVSTEDLHKYMTSPPGYSQATPYIAPHFHGNHMQYVCCPCQMQYCMWQSFMLNYEARRSDPCYCRNSVNSLPSYNNALQYNPFVPLNNSSVYSSLSNHSCCEELMKLELKKSSEVSGTDNQRESQLNCVSNRSAHNIPASEIKGKISVSRIPKLSCSTVNVHDSTKDEAVPSPSEILGMNYSNDFLICSKFPKKEDIFTSDEDPAGINNILRKLAQPRSKYLVE